MKNYLTFIILLVLIKSFRANNPIKEVEKKMKAQEKAWNKGNLDDFMKPYWHNDSLVFIGKNGLTYGWQQTLDNYKKSYSSKDLMGTLQFENKIIRMLGDNTIQVIGKWTLTRPKEGNLSGHYSLIWQIKDGDWVIISDHSS